MAARAGLHTVGFDIDSARVATINGGTSPVSDISDEDLAVARAAGLAVTTQTAQLAECDALFICVPSPLGKNRQPDLSYIEAAAVTVGKTVRPGGLVVLESTTYPGTTEDVIVPAVEAAGLKLDQDVYVAFSPERINPGSTIEHAQIPKLVGGVTVRSGDVAAAAYRTLFDRVHVVSTARAAEMAKLLENIYRAVNIGLINEMAQLAHAIDVDIWEVIEAAATKPFGFQAFFPGPGVGGHCIPLDPQYLAWRAREERLTTRFIDVAEQVNINMPSYAADRACKLLEAHGLPIRDTTILGVGIAYKPNVADDRESAAIDVLRELRAKGARITVLDPVMGTAKIQERGFIAVADAASADAQLAIILTDHDDLDFAAIAASTPIVFDTRGAYRRRNVVATNVVTL